MRAINAENIVMINALTWYLDGEYVRAVQPRTSRDVILPKEYGWLWLLLEHAPKVKELYQSTGKPEHFLKPSELSEILYRLKDLDLVKIVEPGLMESNMEATI